MPSSDSTRRALSVRTRFEIFKRDSFTCQYCGRRSPDVVLECDHIIPVCDGGTDDPMNLVTSCWECNSGKSAVPLNEVMTGEDPHDKAILLLEKERQLEEYNVAVSMERERRDREAWVLWRYWQDERGHTSTDDLENMPRMEYRWLFSALSWCPMEKIREFMDVALIRGMYKNLRYVAACCRNWRYEQTAAKDMRDGGVDGY